MSERYELLYGFVHCRGRTVYRAGYADSREQAEDWLAKNRQAPLHYVKAPPEDPIRYCQAAWCPLKRQKPWFDIRRLPDSDDM